MNRQTRGKRVEFVRNRVADDVCREIRRSVERSRNVNFRPNACFIFGASGAGKTRLGWQAAQALEPPSRATFPSVIPGYFHIAVDELVGVDVAALYGLNQGVAWRSKIPSRAVKLVKARDSNDAAEYLAAHLVNRNRHPEMVHHYKGKLLSEVMQEWASAIRDEALQKWERANTEHVWRAKEGEGEGDTHPVCSCCCPFGCLPATALCRAGAPRTHPSFSSSSPPPLCSIMHTVHVHACLCQCPVCSTHT